MILTISRQGCCSRRKPAINLDKNKKSLGQMVDDYEKEVILELLKKHKGNCRGGSKRMQGSIRVIFTENCRSMGLNLRR